MRFFIPRKTNVFGGMLESACLSVGMSLYVQNTNFCQSAGRVTKSHSVTALIFLVILLHSKQISPTVVNIQMKFVELVCYHLSHNKSLNLCSR